MSSYAAEALHYGSLRAWDFRFGFMSPAFGFLEKRLVSGVSSSIPAPAGISQIKNLEYCKHSSTDVAPSSGASAIRSDPQNLLLTRIVKL